jgi:hypothetical protein
LEAEIILGFYQIPENKETPTIRDRLEVLHLVSEVSRDLIRFAQSYKRRFYVCWGEDEELTCQLHSGFQYLKDDYIDPLKSQLNPYARKSIFEFVEEVDYNELRECMTNWKNNTQCYKPLKKDHVPESHFWWNVLKF